VRPRTYQGYEGLIRLYAMPAIGQMDLGELHPLDLQSLYASLMSERVPPISAGTILHLLLVLTQAFGQPCDGIARSLTRRRRPASSAASPGARRHRRRPRLEDPSRGRGHLLELPIAIALSTGMRRGEILGLRWSDLSFDLSVAHVRRTLQALDPGPVFEDPKTRRSRRAVALPAFLPALPGTPARGSGDAPRELWRLLARERSRRRLGRRLTPQSGEHIVRVAEVPETRGAPPRAVP
jgi:integrase